MPFPVFGSICINYQWDMYMPERNADSSQEFMGVVEVHLFQADAPGSQKISHLKQMTIQSRLQIFSYASASLRG